ncbi:MAG: hypothetical protein PHQ54_04210 [Candidatus Omnitrophica bacterium]|nr:hypothetical protein [Candidatus Omnitrophota bacterium]
MSEKKEIALLYSGGLDTTYLALQLAEKFDKVHLLTFCNGVCVRVNSSQRHVCILQKSFRTDKFEHSIISTAEIFSLLKKGLLKDILKYRSPLLFDLCCRFSMEIATVYYCANKRIRYVTDGNSPKTQGEIFLQQERYLDIISKFFSRYGIEYIRLKNLESRDDKINSLKASGLKTGLRFLGKLGITTQLFTQPFCLWAPVAFFFTSPLRKMPFIKYFDLSVEDAILFRLRKEELVGELIRR